MHTRNVALGLAEKEGAAAAARRLGLPASTVRSWVLRAKHSAEAGETPQTPPEDATRPPKPGPEDSVERLEHMARASRQLADEATAAAREHLRRGEARESREASASAKMASASAKDIEVALATRREVAAQVTTSTQQAVVGAVRAVLRAAGVPSGPSSAVAQALPAALESPTGTHVPAGEAAQAAAELREHFGRRLAPERPEEVPPPVEEPVPVVGEVDAEPEPEGAADDDQEDEDDAEEEERRRLESRYGQGDARVQVGLDDWRRSAPEREREAERAEEVARAWARAGDDVRVTYENLYCSEEEGRRAFAIHRKLGQSVPSGDFRSPMLMAGRVR